MENPICSQCSGQTERVEYDEYECTYCGTLVDEYGDVLHEV